MTETIESRVSSLINHESLDNLQVTNIIKNVTDALKIKINSITVPIELEFIIVEVSVARYRKLGSEGMKSETIDVHTMNFDEDVFAPYQNLIHEWKLNNKQLKKVRFL